MRVVLSLLAEYASAHQSDGRLYIMGGGVRSLTFPAFPAVQSRLALALGIEIEPKELGVDHLLEIHASGPTDQVISRPIRATFRLDQAEPGTPTGYIHFVSNMESVNFPVEGLYEFTITIGSKPLNRLQVSVRRGGRLPDDTEVESLLQDGFRAFGQGDAASAEEIFSKVAERFPHAAAGHNNLGFVLLARGDAQGAIDAFEKAKDLGYPQSEITDANLGAAIYTLGKPQESLDVFVRCLRERFLRTPAVLFGIGPSGLFSIQLRSAADYTSVMALNAAWSALGAGNRESLGRYLEMARASELPMRGGDDSRRFADSVNALESAAGSSG